MSKKRFAFSGKLLDALHGVVCERISDVVVTGKLIDAFVVLAKLTDSPARSTDFTSWF
jgi:hypothetical protein